MNQIILNQKRKAIQDKINLSPEVVTIYRNPLVDNGFGGLVENPTGTPVGHNIKCRVAHEKKGPDSEVDAPSGLSSNLSRFIITDYQTPIYKGETFTAIGKTFMVGAVDTLKMYGAVLGYQAPLTEAEAV